VSVRLRDGVVIVPDAGWTGLLMIRQPHGSSVPVKLSFVPKLSDLFWGFTHLIACWKHIVRPDAQRAFVLPFQLPELRTHHFAVRCLKA
jgi:hypothetical protein